MKTQTAAVLTSPLANQQANHSKNGVLYIKSVEHENESIIWNLYLESGNLQAWNLYVVEEPLCLLNICVETLCAEPLRYLKTYRTLYVEPSSGTFENLNMPLCMGLRVEPLCMQPFSGTFMWNLDVKPLNIYVWNPFVEPLSRTFAELGNF